MNDHSSKIRPLLKICGLTSLDDVQTCMSVGVDFVGFNFFKQSKRWIDPEKACRLWQGALPSNPGAKTRAVGVFVNPTLAELKSVLQTFPALSILQLHGDESEQFIKAASKLRLVWKAMAVERTLPHAVHTGIDESVDLLLLDSGSLAGQGFYGGSGKAFEWDLLKQLPRGVKIGIAGGINVNNFVRAVSFGPHLIDVCSGTEISPGCKDHEKIRWMQKELEKL